MVLESIASALLSKYLGEYIEGRARVVSWNRAALASARGIFVLPFLLAARAYCSRLRPLKPLLPTILFFFAVLAAVVHAVVSPFQPRLHPLFYSFCFVSAFLVTALIVFAGLDSKDLKLEVTSGNVVLKNLKLKRSALRELELPVEIKEGALASFII